MVIYYFKNKTNGKYYVGQTIRTFEERLKDHLRNNATLFDKILQKNNLDMFEYGIICNCDNIDELNEMEKYYIKFYNSMAPNGYNLCYGGGNTFGYKHREESKLKMSIHKKGRYCGEENHFYGKHHSLETREKLKKSWTKERKEKLKERYKTMKHHTVSVINVETKEFFNSIKSAGEKYNIEPTHITRVCKGKQGTAGGYHWKYV